MSSRKTEPSKGGVCDCDLGKAKGEGTCEECQEFNSRPAKTDCWTEVIDLVDEPEPPSRLKKRPYQSLATEDKNRKDTTTGQYECTSKTERTLLSKVEDLRRAENVNDNARTAAMITIHSVARKMDIIYKQLLQSDRSRAFEIAELRDELDRANASLESPVSGRMDHPGHRQRQSQ